MNEKQFGAELTIGGQESSVSAEQKVRSLRQATFDLAESFDRGETSQQEFSAALRTLNAEIRAAEQAERLLAAAREQAAAEASAAAHGADRTHESELQAMAIQHETAMLEHEEQQLRETKAAEDALVDTIGRSIQADLAASAATEALTSDRAAAKITLAQEIDFERLDAQVKRQEAQAARELADAEEDAAAAHRHEAEILGIRTTKTDQYGNAVMHVGGSTRNWGLAALEASRGVEDLQYGIAGGLNNIPTLTMMIGGGAGLTAAISLFAVGTAVAYRHWDDLMGLFGKSSPIPDLTAELKALEEQLKGLEEKKIKVAVDYQDIDIAKGKLDELKRGQTEYEDQKRKQKTTEMESGKLIDELITESPEGAAGVAKGAKDFLKQQAVANSATIREAKAQQAQAEQDLRDAMEVEVPTFGEGGGDMMAGARKRLQAAKDRQKQAEGAIGVQVENQYGLMLNNARTGSGLEQQRGREDLADTLRRSGRGELAGQIAGATPQALEQGDKEDDEFNRRMDRAKAAGEMRRTKAAAAKTKETAARKAQHDAVANALGDINKSDVQDPWDDAVAKWANAESKDLEESFVKAKRKIAENLTNKLSNKGINTTGAEDQIDDQARILADQAFGRVGRLESRQAKAAATAKAKSEKAGTKEAKEETKTEVKQINARVGEEYQERYEASLANNAAFAAQGGAVAHSTAEERKLQRSGVSYALPEDEARKRLRAEMMAGLRRRGATPEAAQRATKEISDKGDIGLQKQLGEAQGDNQQRLMQVAATHNATLAALINRQERQGKDIQAMLGEARQHRRHMSNAPSASNSGGNTQ